MKILHVSATRKGGAGVAAQRIVDCLSNEYRNLHFLTSDTDSRFLNVCRKTRISAGVLFRGMLGHGFRSATNTGLLSPALIPSGWPKTIHSHNPAIVHLHWIGDEFMSVGDIGKIKSPIVWTFHDMWPFCGAEHYTETSRYHHGYPPLTRLEFPAMADINRWVWLRKKKHWLNPIYVVAPSDWMAKCVRSSDLMCDWPVRVIPYPIDVERWKPVNRLNARKNLSLPNNVPIILFGAISGVADKRKGFDLLLKALCYLKAKRAKFELIVFGGLVDDLAHNLPFATHSFGVVTDQQKLCEIYSAVDVMVIPSRQDNLPNAGIEAHACGTPVVAFDVGGLSSIIDHLFTGYLATPFDEEELAEGISTVLSSVDFFSDNARKKAISRFSPDVVAAEYIDVYQEILGLSNGHC